MALIRGLNGIAPCSIYTIKHTDLWDLEDTSSLHTTKETQQILSEARGQRLASQKEKILKQAGLRDIDMSTVILLCLILVYIISNRMHFGHSIGVIHTRPCHLIDYMFFTWVYLEDIFFQNSKVKFKHWDQSVVVKLITSMSSILALLF